MNVRKNHLNVKERTPLKRNAPFFMNLFFIALCLFTVFTLPTKTAAEENETNPQRNVKIASYNIAAGIGSDGEYNLEKIAETIKSTDADIIGLNEVDVHWSERSNFEDTIALLAEKLDMDYYFAPIYDNDPIENGDPRRQYGSGVLSKYPIKQGFNRDITRLSTQDPDPTPELSPGFLEAEIDVDGQSLWFYVSHLDFRPDPTIREMQIEDMFGYMKQHPYSVLVGDMNANPEDPELAPLFQWFNDAWSAVSNEPGFTFPADDPIKRIDYILTSPRIRANSAQVIESLASDHRPVVGDFTLLGETSHSIQEMEEITNQLIEDGSFLNPETSKEILSQLSILKEYESQEDAKQMVKHLEQLKDLLNDIKNNDFITERTYIELTNDTNKLLEKWQENNKNLAESVQDYIDNGQITTNLGDQLLYRLSIINQLIEQGQNNIAIDYLDDFCSYISDPSVLQQELITKEAMTDLTQQAKAWEKELK